MESAGAEHRETESWLEQGTVWQKKLHGKLNRPQI